MKKFICRNCGVVNVASEADLKNNSDWLQCALPQGFEWILPAGKITPVIGEAIYISGMGEHLSREAYLNKHGIDPEIAYNLMRGNSWLPIRVAQFCRTVSDKESDKLKEKGSKLA